MDRHGSTLLKLFLFLLGLAVALALSTSLSGRWPSVPPPASYAAGDLNGDGIDEDYYLQGGTLQVKQGGRRLWVSPPEWKVQQFLLAEVTNDGQQDLVMVLWKKGSFGPHRPFWHRGKDNAYTNHLFVYNLLDQHFHPVWCSSALDYPIARLEIMDINGDGQNELEADEQSPWLQRVFLQKTPPTVWQWQQWGFYRLE